MATEATYNEQESEQKEEAPSVNGFGVVIATLITLMVEGFLLIWAFNSPVSPALLLLVHGIVVLVLIIWARATAMADRPAHMLLLLVILTAFMGPIGAAGAFLALILTAFFDTLPFNEWFSDIFPEEEMPEGQELVEYLQRYHDQVEEEASVIPFREVLLLGTTGQKMRMIGQMARNFHPAFAPGLRLAIQDDDNAVRVQAATAINRIENAYSDQIQLLEKQRKVRGNDIRLSKTLATVYDNYAYAGILDDIQASEYRGRALDYYRDYLKSEPDDVQASLAVARIFYREGSYDELIRWAEACLGRGINDASLILWLMEGYYYKSDYESISRLAARYESLLDEEEELLPLNVREALEAWTQTIEQQESDDRGGETVDA